MEVALEGHLRLGARQRVGEAEAIKQRLRMGRGHGICEELE